MALNCRKLYRGSHSRIANAVTREQMGISGSRYLSPIGVQKLWQTFCS